MRKQSSSERSISTVPSSGTVPYQAVHPTPSSVPFQAVHPTPFSVPFQAVHPTPSSVPFQAVHTTPSSVPFQAVHTTPSSVPFQAVHTTPSSVPFQAVHPTSSSVPFQAVHPTPSSVPFQAVHPTPSSVPFQAVHPTPSHNLQLTQLSFQLPISMRSISPPVSQLPIQITSNTTLVSIAPSIQGTAPSNQGTAPSNQGTAPSNQGTALSNQGTAPSNQGTAPSNQGTALSNQGTAPYNQGTAPSNQGTAPSNQGTAPSNQGTAPFVLGSTCTTPHRVAPASSATSNVNGGHSQPPQHHNPQPNPSLSFVLPIQIPTTFQSVSQVVPSVSQSLPLVSQSLPLVPQVISSIPQSTHALFQLAFSQAIPHLDLNLNKVAQKTQRAAKKEDAMPVAQKRVLPGTAGTPMPTTKRKCRRRKLSSSNESTTSEAISVSGDVTPQLPRLPTFSPTAAAGVKPHPLGSGLHAEPTPHPQGGDLSNGCTHLSPSAPSVATVVHHTAEPNSGGGSGR